MSRDLSKMRYRSGKRAVFPHGIPNESAENVCSCHFDAGVTEGMRVFSPPWQEVERAKPRAFAPGEASREAEIFAFATSVRQRGGGGVCGRGVIPWRRGGGVCVWTFPTSGGRRRRWCLPLECGTRRGKQVFSARDTSARWRRHGSSDLRGELDALGKGGQLKNCPLTVRYITPFMTARAGEETFCMKISGP